MANDMEKKRGPLSACILDKPFMIKLWDNIGRDGEFVWQAKVGTGGDLLGKQEERPEQIITDWNELIELLESLPRIDGLNITFEVPEKGIIGIVFKNYTPAGGILTVIGQESAWIEATFNSLKDLFAEHKEGYSVIYSRLGFGVIQTLIPLSISFVLVMALAAIFIPSHIRHSEWVWWITAGTLVLTLRSAYTISDKMIIHVLKNYPYIRWLS